MTLACETTKVIQLEPLRVRLRALARGALTHSFFFSFWSSRRTGGTTRTHARRRPKQASCLSSWFCNRRLPEFVGSFRLVSRGLARLMPIQAEHIHEGFFQASACFPQSGFSEGCLVNCTAFWTPVLRILALFPGTLLLSPTTTLVAFFLWPVGWPGRCQHAPKRLVLRRLD